VAARSRSDYLEAGLELLAKAGADAVTIASLCTRLGVTKGSFYHHFVDRADFIRKLLVHWERAFGGRTRALILGEADVRKRVALMQEAALRLQDLDGAIRHLARSDPYAAAVLRRVERQREEALVATFRELGIPAERATRLAGIGLALAAGSQQRELRIDKQRFAGLLEEYRRWVEASAPRR
jgi:AcrR family transcriptional regulator